MDNIVLGKFIVTSIEIYFVKSNSKEREKAQFHFKRRFWKIQVLTNVDLECHWCFPVALQKKKITISYFKIKFQMLMPHTMLLEVPITVMIFATERQLANYYYEHQHFSSK